MWRRFLASKLLPQLAGGALPGWFSRTLHAAVRDDPELGARYDALRRIERAASGHSGVSRAQADLLENLVLDAVAAPSPQRSRSLGLSAGAGALAACALLVFAVIPPRMDDDVSAAFPVGELAARSARLEREPLGVKVTCLHADPQNAAAASVVDTATAGARQSGDVLTCPRGSLVAFATTNLGAEARHVFVVGIGPRGDRRWYAPFDKGASATLVPPGQVDAVLPTLADTAGMPPDSRVSLFVLLSDQPFEASAIERQLESSARKGVPLQSLERLPLVDVPLQARIDVVSAPRAE